MGALSVAFIGTQKLAIARLISRLSDDWLKPTKIYYVKLIRFSEAERIKVEKSSTMGLTQNFGVDP